MNHGIKVKLKVKISTGGVYLGVGSRGKKDAGRRKKLTRKKADRKCYLVLKGHHR